MKIINKNTGECTEVTNYNIKPFFNNRVNDLDHVTIYLSIENFDSMNSRNFFVEITTIQVEQFTKNKDIILDYLKEEITTSVEKDLPIFVHIIDCHIASLFLSDKDDE